MITEKALQVLTALLGTVGFGILFNIRGKRLLMASLGGALSWLLYIVLNEFSINEAVNYFIVSLAISVYAEIMARSLKTPTTTFITISLIPLIPGASLYYTMAHAFHGNSADFAQRGLYTLQLASALALGIIVSTALSKILSKFSMIAKNKQ